MGVTTQRPPAGGSKRKNPSIIANEDLIYSLGSIKRRRTPRNWLLRTNERARKGFASGIAERGGGI